MFENHLKLYMHGIFVTTEHLQAILEYKLRIAHSPPSEVSW